MFGRKVCSIPSWSKNLPFPQSDEDDDGESDKENTEQFLTFNDINSFAGHEETVADTFEENLSETTNNGEF